MQRITKYKQADDGTYTAVISGLTLGNDETQLLDEGYSIAVDVQVYDPYKITDKQRSMEQGLMDIKKRTINNADGSIRTTRTTKVTGKGQQYFINKFLG